MKKNERFIKNWMQALRSGHFDQCKYILRSYRTNNFSALGVACHISSKVRGMQEPNHDAGSTVYIDQEGNKNDRALPKAFRKYVGLTNEEQREIFTMNDEEDKSFEEIADYLEDNYISDNA